VDLAALTEGFLADRRGAALDLAAAVFFFFLACPR
jgi:hypothetical protein